MLVKVETSADAQIQYSVPMTRLILPDSMYLLECFFSSDADYEDDFQQIDKRIARGRRWNGEGQPPSWGGNGAVALFKGGRVVIHGVSTARNESIEVSQAAFHRLYALWKRGWRSKETIQEDIPELEAPV